jgi:PhnB protein
MKARRKTKKVYFTVTPYIIVKNAAKAIQFYVKGLGAKEESRLVDPTTGKIGHADLVLGDGWFMLADEHPDWGALSPASVGGTPVYLHAYVKDDDAVVKRAAKLGATVLREPKDEFFGDRNATIVDPFGHQWLIATHKEDVSTKEMQKRWSKAVDA